MTICPPGPEPVPDFEALFRAAPSLLLVFTPGLTIVAASDAYLQATRTRREEIVGRQVFDVFPENPDDAAMRQENRARSSFERVIRDLVPDTPGIIQYDIPRPAAEGGGFEERYWSPVNVPLLGADGKLLCIIHRVEDVTEFVRLQRQHHEERRSATELQERASRMQSEVFQRAQQLQEANRKMQSANEELSRKETELRRMSQQLAAANHELEAFSYSVSHDLRAPLRHIDGFADLLRRHAGNALDEKAGRLLDVISESARSMGRLIEDLLVFSRMARAEVRRTRVPLGPLVTEVIASLRPDTEGRAIAWRVGRLPEVQGDPALLKLVFENLLGNAVKYTRPREQALIRVGVERDGADTVVAVRDNGVGFDMKYAGKLFGVFQRLHRSDEFEGTGVGLSSVKRIVERYGGRVWAESAPGEGATFRFTLPRSEAPAAGHETEEAA